MPLFQYSKLRELQRQSYVHYFYEATVGAGLPIISTLRGLLETGDKIVKVEGIFRSVKAPNPFFFCTLSSRLSKAEHVVLLQRHIELYIQ